MKPISESMLAAMKRPLRRPAVQVIVDNRVMGVPRTRWTLVETRVPNPVEHSAMAAGAGDDGTGSLLWIVNDHTGTLFFQRRYPADVGLNYELATGAKVGAPCALCTDPATRTGWAFWIASDGRTIKGARSTDDGVNFSAPATIAQVASGHQITGLTAVTPANGLHEVILLYTDAASTNPALADKTVRCIVRANGVWTSDAAWARSPGKQAFGLAAINHSSAGTHSEVWFVLAGQFEELSKGANVQVYRLTIDGAGNRTWELLSTPLQAAGSAVSWRWPAMVQEVEVDRTRIFLQRHDTSKPAGSQWQSGSVYIQQLTTTDPLVYGDWLPFDARAEATFGVARVWDALWLSESWGRLWRAPLYTPSDEWRVDITADVIAFQHAYYDNSLFLENVTRAGWGYVILDNHDGRFAGLGRTGKYQAIQRGAQVIIKAGYLTEAGEEVELLAPMWINRIIQVNNPAVTPGRGMPRLSVPEAPMLSGSYVILALYDGWAVATHRLAKEEETFLAYPRTVLQQTLGKMGFRYADDGTAALGVGLETWQTLPGRPYWPMIKGILNHTGTRLKFYTEADEERTYPTARAYVFSTSPNDPVDLAIGGDGEVPLYASIYWEQDRASWLRWMWWYNPPPEVADNPAAPPIGAAVNGVVVEGKDTSAEHIAYEAMEQTGFYQPALVIDPNIGASSAVTAEARAATAARDAVQGMQAGCVMIPVHPGLELWDRLELTDARACYSPLSRRVAGIETYYDRREKRWVYEQIVYLWGIEPW